MEALKNVICNLLCFILDGSQRYVFQTDGVMSLLFCVRCSVIFRPLY